MYAITGMTKMQLSHRASNSTCHGFVRESWESYENYLKFVRVCEGHVLLVALHALSRTSAVDCGAFGGPGGVALGKEREKQRKESKAT